MKFITVCNLEANVESGMDTIKTQSCKFYNVQSQELDESTQLQSTWCKSIVLINR